MSAAAVCLEMDALLAELSSGDLSGEDRVRVEAHLAHCERCRDGLERYEEALRIAGDSSRPFPGERGRDLASSTLRRWKRGTRVRTLAAATVAGALAAAAAASLTLAPGLGGNREPHPARDEVRVAPWEPDVDGALEASGVGRDLYPEEGMSTEDVVLAAFDAAEEE